MADFLARFTESNEADAISKEQLKGSVKIGFPVPMSVILEDAKVLGTSSSTLLNQYVEADRKVLKAINAGLSRENP